MASVTISTQFTIDNCDKHDKCDYCDYFDKCDQFWWKCDNCDKCDNSEYMTSAKCDTYDNCDKYDKWWIFWYFDKCDQFWWKCDKCDNFNTYELVTIVTNMTSVTTCQVEFSITFSESFCKKDSTMLSFVPCVDFYKQMRSLKESKNPLVLRPPHCTFHSNNRLQTVCRCS